MLQCLVWMKAGLLACRPDIFVFLRFVFTLTFCLRCNSPFHPVPCFVRPVSSCLSPSILADSSTRFLLIRPTKTVHFQEKMKLHRNALDFTGRDSEVHPQTRWARPLTGMSFPCTANVKKILFYQTTLNVNLWSKERLFISVSCPKRWRKNPNGGLWSPKELLLLSLDRWVFWHLAEGHLIIQYSQFHTRSVRLLRSATSVQSRFVHQTSPQ